MRNVTLYSHQREAITRGYRNSLAMFHDCGTGKTLSAIGILERHKASGLGPALVVCPLTIIKDAWTDQLTQFSDLNFAVIHGDKGRRILRNSSHDVYVTNFEMVKSLYEDICDKQFATLVVDESSKIKNPKSQITKAILALAGFNIKTRTGTSYRPSPIPYRYVLSGTPAPNNYFEYWAQVKAITGPGNDVFHDSFPSFMGTYFINYGAMRGLRFPIWRIRSPRCEEEILRCMAKVCHVVRKQDALDLPEQVDVRRSVTLSPEERSAYERFRKDLVLKHQDVTIMAPTIMTEMMKLRQFTSGFFYDQNDGEPVEFAGQSKLQDLAQVVEELGSNQAIIWIQFDHEIEMIRRMMAAKDKTFSILCGQTENRPEEVDDFKSGKNQFFVVNPGCGKYGLNLFNASYAIYYSMNYSYESYDQSRDRIHRIGQEKKCTYIHMIATDTIDELIYDVVKRKEQASDAALAWLHSNQGKDSDSAREGSSKENPTAA